MRVKPPLEKVRRYVYTVNDTKNIQRGKAGECDEMPCVSVQVKKEYGAMPLLCQCLRQT